MGADEAGLDQRHSRQLLLAEGVAVLVDQKEQSVAAQAARVDLGALERHAPTRLDRILGQAGDPHPDSRHR
jgi:hypothetical protein